jgi:hypothetical protein
MQPRQSHYDFAHRLLAADAHRPNAEVWPMITGPQAAMYFAMKWDMAGGDPALTSQIRLAAQTQMGPWQLVVVAAPEALNATEAHFVAYARNVTGGPVRYFVMEKGATTPPEPPRAFVAEWRADQMRIRHGDLPAVTLDAFMAHLGSELGGAPSISPMSYGSPPGMAMPMHRPQPQKSSGVGKWIAVGAVGLIGTIGGLIAISSHLTEKEWREREEKREAAAKAAKDETRDAKKRAEDALAAVDKPLAACTAAHQTHVNGVVDKAKAASSLSTRSSAPKDKNALVGAMAYNAPTEEQPVASAAFAKGEQAWIPTTAWISRKGSLCAELPKAYADLKAELVWTEPYDYASDFAEKHKEHAEKLDRLSSELKSVKIDTPAHPPVVVVSNDCTTTTIASYNGVGGLGTYSEMDLYRYSCTAKLVWLDANGKVLAAAVGTGNANPTEQPMTSSTSQLASLNSDTEGRAEQQAAEALQKMVTGWAK